MSKTRNQDKNEVILEQRIHEYIDMITGYCFHLSNGNPHLAQDLVQETLLKVWRAQPFAALTGETYFKTVIRSVFIDELRRRKRHEIKVVKYNSSRFVSNKFGKFIYESPFVEYYDTDDSSAVFTLEKLTVHITDLQWEIFKLKAKGCTTIQVSEALGLGEKKIKTEMKKVRDLAKTI